MARPTIHGRLEGFDQTIKNLRKFGQAMDTHLQKLVENTAVRVQRTAVTSIQRGPKTGRVYKRGGVTHRASAPGQPPATDTGDLASSVARVDGELVAAVGTALGYGRDLEFGTSQMAARPWLLPALEASRAHFEGGLKKLGEQAARGLTTKKKR
jgi:phage gpG-like protein